MALADGHFHREISIHALREEGDVVSWGMNKLLGDFYPRPPRGGRLVVGSVEKLKTIFLSTPSARRATTGRTPKHHAESNFYPRPPRGGRPQAAQGEDQAKIFLSTPSARRATDGDARTAQIFRFLSTPSARRATIF